MKSSASELGLTRIYGTLVKTLDAVEGLHKEFSQTYCLDEAMWTRNNYFIKYFVRIHTKLKLHNRVHRLSSRGGRGGGHSQKDWVGMRGPLPKTLTLFMTKICDIPYPINDLTKNSKPYLWPEPYIKNPYIKNSKPYLWPEPYIKILFQTCVIITGSLVQTNVNLCKAFVDFLFNNDEKVGSRFKNIRIPGTEYKNQSLFMTKMAKISENRYPIYDQNGWKTIPFGAAHAYITHTRNTGTSVPGLSSINRPTAVSTKERGCSRISVLL